MQYPSNSQSWVINLGFYLRFPKWELVIFSCAAAVTKTGEHVGKKAGDKIVQMLSKSNNSKPKVTFNKNVETIPSKKEINQRLNALLSGGSTRKRKII